MVAPSLFMARKTVELDADDDLPDGIPRIVTTPRGDGSEANIFAQFYDGDDANEVITIDDTVEVEGDIDLFYEAVQTFDDLADDFVPFANVATIVDGLAGVDLAAPPAMTLVDNHTKVRLQCRHCDGTAVMQAACRSCHPTIARRPAYTEHGYLVQTAIPGHVPHEAPSDETNDAHHGCNGGDSVESIHEEIVFEELADDASIKSNDVGRCKFCGSEGPLGTYCGSCCYPDRLYQPSLNFFAGL
jgi:hypothetical protein